MATHPLSKSRTDRVIGGVCGGLAEHYGIDSMLVRLAFVVLALLSGLGLLLYIILLLVMPKAGMDTLTTSEVLDQNAGELGQELAAAGEVAGEKLEQVAAELDQKTPKGPARWIVYGVIALAALFLLGNLRSVISFAWNGLFVVVIVVALVWLFLSARSKGKV